MNSVNPLSAGLLVGNLCKLFEGKGFCYLDLPLTLNGMVRRDLTSAMLMCSINKFDMVYKYGVVVRLERHCDIGRYRQFVQFDFDTFGLNSLSNDMRLVCCVYELSCLMSLTHCVKCVLNTKRVLLGFSEVLGVLNYPAKMAGVLRALDKSATLALVDVFSLLAVGKYDISGDFVPGLGISLEFAVSKLGLAYCLPKRKLHASNFRLNLAFLSLLSSYFGEFGMRELLCYNGELLACGLLEKFVVLKPLFNRGLEYYTGAIFELVSEVVVMSEKNVFVKIGSLAGGGRFDWYVSKHASIGCSVGISRVLAFLRCIRRKFGSRSTLNKVFMRLANGFDCADYGNSLAQLGYSVKSICGVSFANALKLARNSAIMLFCKNTNWIVKLLVKRVYLQSKIFKPLLWRSLFIDQFVINNKNLFNSVCALLVSAHKYVRF